MLLLPQTQSELPPLTRALRSPAQLSLPTLCLCAAGILTRASRTRADRRTYLVGNAVENFHSQVGDVGIGVSSEVKEYSPNLGVNAVETHTYNKEQNRKQSPTARDNPSTQTL